MVSLEQIQSPIAAEMVRFADVFKLRVGESNPLLQKVITQVTSRRGKMMRPLLTMLSARLFGAVNDATMYAAASFELFHTASLVHDDVVDESDKRRGQGSINSLFDNKVAVLIGDYLLGEALHFSSKVRNFRILDILSGSAKELVDGELLQLYNIANEEITEDVYFSIIKRKTAALFSACAESGALSVTDNEEDVATMREFGETIGICFQIRDDIFDYYDEGNIGKPTGNDMKEGKLTLPVIHVLLDHPDDEIINIAYKVKGREVSKEEIARLVEYTKQHGGIEYAVETMEKLAKKAKQSLDKYPDSDIKQALLDYVDFVVGREV